MPSVAVILQELGLALRIHSVAPEVSLADAFEHATAAVDVATPRVSAELLLAIAYVESRYDRTATSRVEGKRRRTGGYPSTEPPRDLARRASLYCGPLQTFARSWQECIALRDFRVAYAAAVTELEQWLRDKRVHGNLERALAGHGCGNHGVVTGRCNSYPARVRYMARRLAPATTRRSRPET